MKYKEQIDFSSIGLKIKNKRVQLGLSQEQLAEMCGVTPSYIGHIERASRNLSLVTAIRISSALEMSLDYLLLDLYGNDCGILESIGRELENHSKLQKDKFLGTVKILAENIDRL